MQSQQCLRTHDGYHEIARTFCWIRMSSSSSFQAISVAPAASESSSVQFRAHTHRVENSHVLRAGLGAFPLAVGAFETPGGELGTKPDTTAD